MMCVHCVSLFNVLFPTQRCLGELRLLRALPSFLETVMCYSVAKMDFASRTALYMLLTVPMIKQKTEGLPWWSSGEDSELPRQGPGFNLWSGY